MEIMFYVFDVGHTMCRKKQKIYMFSIENDSFCLGIRVLPYGHNMFYEINLTIPFDHFVISFLGFFTYLQQRLSIIWMKKMSCTSGIENIVAEIFIYEFQIKRQNTINLLS